MLTWHPKNLNGGGHAKLLLIFSKHVTDFNIFSTIESFLSQETVLTLLTFVRKDLRQNMDH